MNGHIRTYARGPAGRGLPRWGALVAVLFALAVVALPGSRDQASAQTGTATLHTLTLADNGTTLTIPVGDSVELRLDTSFDWTITGVSDVTVLHRPPLALIRGVQGLWNAVAPGQAVITATGDPPCRSSTPPCAAPSILFKVTINVVPGGNPPPPSAKSVTYPAGWNLVGLPPKSILPVDAYSWDPLAVAYSTVGAGSQLKAGQGYWAYFAAPTTVPLSPGTTTAEVFAPAGAWVLAGNPSALSSAQVSGADVVYTWDPVSSAYSVGTTIAPGGGAWVRSAAGGTVTITAPN